MKQLLIILFISVSFTSCFISSSPVSGVIQPNKYNEISEVKTIRVPMLIAKPVVKGQLRKEGIEKEYIKLIRKVKKLRVMTGHTKDKNIFNINKGEEWLRVNSKDAQVKIVAKQKGNLIKNLYVYVSGLESNFVYVGMKCRISADDIADLINTLLKSDEVEKIIPAAKS